MVRCAVARSFRSRPEEIEDGVQETFIRLFRALHQYDPSRPIETYILEIARRVAISRFRNVSAVKRGGLNPGHAIVDPQDAGGEAGYVCLTSRGESQEEALMREQDARLLRKALEKLSEFCKTLLAMRYDAELTYKDIAAQLDMREGTLRVKVQRCLSALAARYREVSLGEVSPT
jgi:RNA polymerase sigma-70 factor (ECF subfamily)